MDSTRRLEQLSGLVHQVYAASAEPGRWTATVGAIAQAVGATRAILYTPFVEPFNVDLQFSWRIEENAMASWATSLINCHVWAQDARHKGVWQEGAVVVDENCVPQEEPLASNAYREFLNTIGVRRVCSGVVFEAAPDLPCTCLSVFRDLDDPFGSTDRDLIRWLMPHLSKSLGLMHRLNRASYEMASLRSALDRFSVGVFLLDHSLRTKYINSAGQKALDCGDGLALDSRRRLTAPGFQRNDGLRLEDWLVATTEQLEPARGRFLSTFEVARKNPSHMYRVQCCTCERSDPLVVGIGACHIVFVTDPKRVELPDHQELQAILGITLAESRVSRALVQGGSYRDVAASLGISEETVRTQIRSVYAKTRATDKASLTRMVLSLSKAAL